MSSLFQGILHKNLQSLLYLYAAPTMK